MALTEAVGSRFYEVCPEFIAYLSFTTNRFFLYLEVEAGHLNGRKRRVCRV